VKLDKEKVKKLFEEETDHENIVIELYKTVFPKWNSIKNIKNWPKINKKTNEEIMSMFIDFDRIHHKNVFPGGVWMNYGFSSDNSVNEWEVDLSQIKIIYN